MTSSSNDAVKSFRLFGSRMRESGWKLQENRSQDRKYERGETEWVWFVEGLRCHTTE